MANRCIGWVHDASQAEKDALRTAVAVAAGKKRGIATRVLPDFFGLVPRSGLVCVNPHAHKAEPRAYASEAFAWRLLNHKHPSEMTPHSPSPMARLGTLPRVACPLYEDRCGRRYGERSMLEGAAWHADAAFLGGLWYYGQALEGDVFPLGLHFWHK